MHRFWALPLRRQLFIAILLLIIPVLAAAAWSGLSTFRERVAELGDQARVLAVTTAGFIDNDLTSLDRMVRGLSTNPALQGLDPVRSAQLLRPQTLQRPSVVEIVLVDRNGSLVARTGEGEELVAAASELASPVLESGDRIVSPMRTTQSGLRYLAISYPIQAPSGAVAGVLVCYINPQRLEAAVGSLPLPAGSVVTLTDAAGMVLARNVDGDRWVGKIASTGQLPDAQPRAPQERPGIDGVRRMYGEAQIADGPWLVSVGIPVSIAAERAMGLWRRSFTILALGLAGWLLVALVFSRQLTQSLGHLDQAAQRIASGDLSPIERRPMPTREFSELQAAFDQMLGGFNDTKKALDAQMAEERGIRQQLQSLQRQVIRQERLAAVGQLVSGVAHEINNPLQAILGFAELLQMQTDVPESVKSDLILIQKESARACGIIRNLALFARQQTGDAAAVRLTDVIASVAELRQRRLETEDIELRIEDRSSQHVLAVMTELQQVVLNFVVNAEQAIVTSKRLPGRITIRTRDEDDRVVLEVEDTGPGIPPDNEAKLFQPFFTTKPVGQGTGLGLSVSYGIIDSLGGHIGYRSAPAGGAVFFFALPAAASFDVA
jgi:signal transduction histidine kinase